MLMGIKRVYVTYIANVTTGSSQGSLQFCEPLNANAVFDEQRPRFSTTVEMSGAIVK